MNQISREATLYMMLLCCAALPSCKEDGGDAAATDTDTGAPQESDTPSDTESETERDTDTYTHATVEIPVVEAPLSRSIAVTGITDSPDFSVSASPFQSERADTDAVDGTISVLDLADNGDYSIRWSTLFGGSASDLIRAVAVDEEGNLYVGGETRSEDLPLLNNLYEGVPGASDAFLASFTPDGTLRWSTYFGGRWYESVEVLRVVDDGVVFGGFTSSDDFPITDAAAQKTCGGHPDGWSFNDSGDIFVAKMSRDGQQLVFSTFLGGESFERLSDMVIEADNSILIAGYSRSLEPAGTPGVFQEAHAPNDEYADETNNADGMIARLSPDGSEWQTISYLGGRNDDYLSATTVGEDGDAYVGGSTHSEDFPHEASNVVVFNGYTAGFVMRFSSDLSEDKGFFELGNDWDTHISSVRADAEGVWLAGNTTCTTLPTNENSLRSIYYSDVYGANGFLARLSPAMDRLEQLTYLLTAYPSLKRDSTGRWHLFHTASRDWLDTTSGGSPASGETDFYWSILQPDLQRVDFATYFGGTGSDQVTDVTLLN